jgi:formylglycine-generating enzyme required for sulfatase activity
MRWFLMALGLVLALGACGGGTAGQDAGLLVDGMVGLDLLDGSHLDLADTGLEIGNDGVNPDADQLALPDQSDTFDTLHPDTQDTWHPDTSDTNTPDTLHPDTSDTNTPDTVSVCTPPCGPYQLCNPDTLLCEANPLCQTEFCAGEDAGMEKVQGLALYYLDRFEWPNQQGVVPEGGVASLGAATQKCLSMGKRLCTGLELAIGCSPGGQTYPYGNAYNQTACNTELPWAADPSGANEGCHAAASGIYDLAGNLAEWSAEGKLFGGTVKEGLDGTCARLAAPGDYADTALLGLRCCLSPTDDLDADGAQASLDCDDSNDEVRPGEEEVCNGLDDDCDGQTDNTEDADQDDYNTCTDCNDKSGSIHPGAEDQFGDGVDADCDGVDGTDQDQDGAISMAGGGTDCDDGNPLVFPGASELCDGQDNDCDEVVDEVLCDDDLDCNTGDRLCDGDFGYRTCQEGGNGWSARVDCDPGKHCDHGDCKPQVCHPDEPACVNGFAGICNATGGALLPGHSDCQSLPQTPFCEDGRCLACIPLSRVCLNDMAFKCDQQGQEWVLMKDCPVFGDLCVDGQCLSQCSPDCTGKICGDDGCGGSCGVCGAGGSCVEGTRCTYAGTGGVTWVAIPGGTFQMGCSAGDSNCGVDEKPVHQVTLSGFEMLETEITEGQFLAVMGSNPSQHFNGASGPNMPVENINWSYAEAFCKAIGGRLPTEAEWEYAARGGTTTRYYCGDASTCLSGIAWYYANSGNSKQPVKGKTANAYGLYDMLGNVWEWTNDWYGSYPTGAQTNPPGPDSGTSRVVRGHDFGNGDGELSVSYRFDILPSNNLPHLGGRCARSK